MFKSFWKKSGSLSLVIAFLIAFSIGLLFGMKADLKLILLLFALAFISIAVGHILAQTLQGESPVAAAKPDSPESGLDEILQHMVRMEDEIFIETIHQEGVFFDEPPDSKIPSDIHKPAI